MLNATVLDTQAFLSWIAGTGKVSVRRMATTTLRKAMASEFCGLAFRDGSGSSPKDGVVVVVDPQRMREFFAFVSTYVVDHVPFSAFFRVISSDRLDMLVGDPEAVWVGDGRLAARDLVGIPIAEAAMHLRSRHGSDDVRPLSLGAVNASYSMSALQGLANSGASGFAEIGRRWTELRSMLGSDQLPLPTAGLVEFWELVGAAIGTNERSLEIETVPLVSVLKRAVSLRSVTGDMVVELSAAIPELRGRPLRLSGTREDRAKVVRDALELMGTSDRRKGHAEACMAGCLLSLLGDGSLKFLPSALSASVTPSLTPLWFALWCSIHPENDIMTRFNCLGRRIARDLSVPMDLYDPPVDDIALDEFVLVGPNIDIINRGQSGSIAVEIQPGISTRQGLVKPPVASQKEEDSFRDELRELRFLMARSSELVDRMEGSEATRRGTASYRKKSRPGSRRDP